MDGQCGCECTILYEESTRYYVVRQEDGAIGLGLRGIEWLGQLYYWAGAAGAVLSGFKKDGHGRFEWTILYGESTRYYVVGRWKMEPPGEV